MHEATNLVTSSNVLFFSVQMNTLSNVGGLLLQSHQYIAGLIVEAWRTRQQSLSFTSILNQACFKYAL